MKDERLIQAIAESMPGWPTEEDYEWNLQYTIREQERVLSMGMDFGDDAFEACLANLNERPDGIKAAALKAAESYVKAIRPLLKEIWNEGAEAASEYSGGYLRAIQVGNPYNA